MNIHISHNSRQFNHELIITGSKSESNRLLILQSLFPNIQIENLSNSDDTRVMQMALASNSQEIDIHHAGTAMRFLTAYFASVEGKNVVLTGSKRMQERPIKLLVDSLRKLGADIEYALEEGYPPLRIQGKTLQNSKVKVNANISSQYISALMLIGSSLPNGLEIDLEGNITSRPYINMTLEILQHFGIEAIFDNKTIKIKPVDSLQHGKIYVESDWSSASYFYSMIALSEEGKIKLSHYRKSSLQGDSQLISIYKQLGVKTTFEDKGIIIEKVKGTKPARLQLDLKNTPDLAQTIAVTCLGLGIGCELTGLETLKIKETDRLLALQKEMSKFGAKVKVTNDSLQLLPCPILQKNVTVETYNDHRMAMAFAPLGIFVPLEIVDYEVVFKSYPQFWDDLKMLGFTVD